MVAYLCFSEGNKTQEIRGQILLISTLCYKIKVMALFLFFFKYMIEIKFYSKCICISNICCYLCRIYSAGLVRVTENNFSSIGKLRDFKTHMEVELYINPSEKSLICNWISSKEIINRKNFHRFFYKLDLQAFFFTISP